MSVDKDGYRKIVNTSISQTLTRNIYTTITTFATVLMLYIFGVPSLKEFTLALMAGLICGAYSSVFITGPLWLFLKTHIGVKKEETKKGKEGSAKSGKKAKKQ
jgi:SecD/SecF fusion protein